MKHLQLQPRLRLLADMVPAGAHLADIGTDHGYLPVWLMQQGRIASAIAADIGPEPLAHARRTAAEYGAALDLRLCDGLRGIAPHEADTLVMAGMGGETIIQILTDSPWPRTSGCTLLLQPQSRGETLRAFLADHGYAIRREALVEDRGHIYPVLEAGAGEMTLSPGRLLCGPRIASDPLGDRYLIEKIIQLQAAAAGLGRSARPEDAAKADAVRDVLTELLELREEWRHANGTGN